MTYEIYQEMWTSDEIARDEDHEDTVSPAPTGYTEAADANLQYCIANHLM